jgi:peptidoglycan hydrolase CwlO-like protein
MAITLTFKNLTDAQKADFIQKQAEIYKLRKMIEDKRGQIEILNGDIRNLELEISEREKLLKQLDI